MRPSLRSLIFALLVGFPGVAPVAHAQCMLANPSFEVSGTGTTFGGWSQFGPTASSPDAPFHGQSVARVSGPNNGNWDVAGYFQALDTSPGKSWKASIRVRPRSSQPLAGGSRALLNIEWRSSAGALLSYESHEVADPMTRRDLWTEFSITSGPAPAGTSKVRLLVGVLQGPGDPQPTVDFDAATMDPAGPPTLDQLQWNDFPGGRTIEFAGHTWRVKGPGLYGPGPNLFCDSGSCVWVDASDRLHLTLQNLSGQWYSTEVVTEEALGYGDYVFTTVGRLDQLDPRVVFGLFLWQYGPCYDTGYLWWNAFNEIDVEFSRWGNPANGIAQFVAQPYDWAGNIERFDASFAPDEITSHAFRWLPDRVEFRSWRGGPGEESPGSLIRSWTYTGPHVPRPEQPRVHLNLWRPGQPPAVAQEVVLADFTFVPEASTVDVSPEPEPDSESKVSLGATVRPNPATGSARIEWTLPRESDVALSIFDVAGRIVRTLTTAHHAAGTHGLVWDGLDGAGRRVAAGTYLLRIEAVGLTETRRIVLLR